MVAISSVIRLDIIFEKKNRSPLVTDVSCSIMSFVHKGNTTGLYIIIFFHGVEKMVSSMVSVFIE